MSPVALKFDTGMKYRKLDAQICHWLDKHPQGVRDDTFCIRQFF